MRAQHNKFIMIDRIFFAASGQTSNPYGILASEYDVTTDTFRDLSSGITSNSWCSAVRPVEMQPAGLAQQYVRKSMQRSSSGAMQASGVHYQFALSLLCCTFQKETVATQRIASCAACSAAGLHASCAPARLIGPKSLQDCWCGCAGRRAVWRRRDQPRRWRR